MSDWKFGDRVQTDKKGVIRVGAITNVDSKEVQRTKHDWYTRKQVAYTEIDIVSIDVKWDDGEEQKGLGQYDVYPEDSEMERTFRLAVSEAHNRIDEKMSEAYKAVQEAVKISEETGIPFSASVFLQLNNCLVDIYAARLSVRVTFPTL